MFENPLKKYAAGGVTSAEQQKLERIFSKAASKLNIKPEILIQKVQELSGEQQIGFVQAIQDIADNEKPNPKSVQIIQNVFAQSNQIFKNGGKIHDFLCKHSHGGHVADCGCNKAQQGLSLPNSNRIQYLEEKLEKGGQIESAQRGTLLGRLYDKYIGRRAPNTVEANNRRIRTWTDKNGVQHIVEEANVNGNSTTTTIDINGADTSATQKVITGVDRYRPIVLQQGTPEWRAVMERNIPQQKSVENTKVNVMEPIPGTGLFPGTRRYRVNEKAFELKQGGEIEKAKGGKKVNNKRKTITEVGSGLDEYDAKKLGIDPNTLAGTSSIITAYPNKKPYVVNGQVPFWTRNGLVFGLGGVESDRVEDGVRLGKGISGRKYKVSSVLGQSGMSGFDYDENVKEFPMISRYASPKDTIYYLNFNDFDKNTLGYEEVRSLYNKAIDQPDTFALDRDAYLELQRQRQERAPKKEAHGGEIRKKESTNVIKGQNGFLNIWQKAYDSKLGKGLRNFMFGTDSNLSDEEYIKKHGYNKPIMGMPPAVKISYIPEGVYGSAKMAEQAAKAAKEASKFKHVSPLDGGRLGHIIKDVSGVHLKNNGGKVEKAQDGSIIDYYKDKWNSDWNHIKQAWGRFKESAPGKVWGAFIPNPNSETGMLGAAAPVGKISSLGKAVSKLDDEVKVLGYYDDLGNFIKTEGDDVLRNAGNYMNKPKWPEFEIPDYSTQPNFIEPDYSGIDFNNLVTPHADLSNWIIGGGIAAGAGAAAGAAIHQNKKEKQENTKTNKKQNK